MRTGTVFDCMISRLSSDPSRCSASEQALSGTFGGVNPSTELRRLWSCATIDIRAADAGEVDGSGVTESGRSLGVPADIEDDRGGSGGGVG